MRRTSRLVLLGGIFLAALTFIVVIVLLQGNGGTGNPSPSAATTQSVVVAAVDIPLGTIITADMVQQLDNQPIAGVNPGTLQLASAAIGQKAYAAITAGQQITADMLSATSGGNFPHPDPGVGKRAFAFSVNETTGVGNLVQVGDFVDILISEKITTVQKNPDGTVATVPGLDNALTVKMPVLVENVQIIGIINQVAAAPAQGGAPAASAPPTLTGASKLLILAVTPEQAEVLLFARTSGTLDVVYRSPNDTATVSTDGVILKTLIDKYGVVPPNIVLVTIP